MIESGDPEALSIGIAFLEAVSVNVKPLTASLISSIQSKIFPTQGH